MRDVGKKMIYNNPSYLCFKNRKPNIEILHNIYNMYKYTKSLRDTLPSIGMKCFMSFMRKYWLEMSLEKIKID